VRGSPPRHSRTEVPVRANSTTSARVLVWIHDAVSRIPPMIGPHGVHDDGMPPGLGFCALVVNRMRMGEIKKSLPE